MANAPRSARSAGNASPVVPPIGAAAGQISTTEVGPAAPCTRDTRGCRQHGGARNRPREQVGQRLVVHFVGDEEVPEDAENRHDEPDTQPDHHPEQHGAARAPLIWGRPRRSADISVRKAAASSTDLRETPEAPSGATTASGRATIEDPRGGGQEVGFVRLGERRQVSPDTRRQPAGCRRVKSLRKSCRIPPPPPAR